MVVSVCNAVLNCIKFGCPLNAIIWGIGVSFGVCENLNGVAYWQYWAMGLCMLRGSAILSCECCRFAVGRIMGAFNLSVFVREKWDVAHFFCYRKGMPP